MSGGRQLTWQWRATSIFNSTKVVECHFLSISTNDRPAIVVKIDEPFARQNFLNADH